MITAFCLRLAWGLIAALLVLPTTQVPPWFFRVQYLTSLGLLAVAFFFVPDWRSVQAFGLALSLGCCFLGSIVWHVDKAPLARTIGIFSVLALSWALYTVSSEPLNNKLDPLISVVDGFTSAALLGGCFSAMLMGHSYLIAPAMSLGPLMRLLAAAGFALLIRVALASVSLFLLLDRVGLTGLDMQDLGMLAARWLLGFFGVLMLGWMSWESARIRSTQSATGILYVVVIFCFLGELSSLVLAVKGGYIL